MRSLSPSAKLLLKRRPGVLDPKHPSSTLCALASSVAHRGGTESLFQFQIYSNLSPFCQLQSMFRWPVLKSSYIYSPGWVIIAPVLSCSAGDLWYHSGGVKLLTLWQWWWWYHGLLFSLSLSNPSLSSPSLNLKASLGFWVASFTRSLCGVRPDGLNQIASSDEVPFWHTDLILRI